MLRCCVASIRLQWSFCRRAIQSLLVSLTTSITQGEDTMSGTEICSGAGDMRGLLGLFTFCLRARILHTFTFILLANVV